jgi:hypothetical protein
VARHGVLEQPVRQDYVGPRDLSESTDRIEYRVAATTYFIYLTTRSASKSGKELSGSLREGSEDFREWIKKADSSSSGFR